MFIKDFRSQEKLCVTTNPRILRLDRGIFSHALLDSHPSKSFFFFTKNNIYILL